MSRVRFYATTTTCLIAAALLSGCDKESVSQAKPKKAAATSSSGDIPGDYLQLYQTAPRCTGLSWQVLAAVGKIETDHGRSPLPGVHSGTNEAGAAGPMQFLAATFRGVRKRHPEIGGNVYNPAHAIPAAAHKLCDDGARNGDVRKALYAYNHSRKYVNDVLTQAGRY